MDSKQALYESHHPIAYVRPVKVADLPESIRKQVDGHETLYSVHNEDGERLAILSHEKLAYYFLRSNDMKPLTVH